MVIFMLTGSVLAGTVGLLYHLETKDNIARLKIEEQSSLQLQAAIITNSLEDVVSDLMVLSKLNELLHWFESAEERYTDEMAREYLAFSRQKNKYDQIRFIDAAGMEKVRINYNGGAPAILPASHLSFKGERYYFKDTMALSQDDFFVSPFDLNIEKGEIETPLKPMIRFGVPVFDNTKRKRGIVILNYLGDRLIAAIRQAGQLSVGDTMLVNSDGYWLCSPKHTDAWGFMIAERKQRKFSLDFPAAWKTISAADGGQINNENGLFTFRTIYPLKEDFSSSSGSGAADGSSAKSVKRQGYYWKIISHIPAQRLRSGTHSLLIKLTLLSIALFLLAALPSWFIAQLAVRRKLHQAELYRSANYDKLTDLPNRSLFSDRLNQILNQSKRYERKFVLLFIDLDGFKSVNDTLGHDAGDDLLIAVAERLSKCVRDSDTVARMGGDEFTVILSDIKTAADAETVARKIIAKISVPFIIKGQETRIGASIGITVFPENGRDAEILLKKADAAMYLAKQQGKNDYRVSEA